MKMTGLPISIAAPARRALDRAGLTSLEQLAKQCEADVAALHGMGPKAMATIKAAMSEKRLQFASPKS